MRMIKTPISGFSLTPCLCRAHLRPSFGARPSWKYTPLSGQPRLLYHATRTMARNNGVIHTEDLEGLDGTTGLPPSSNGAREISAWVGADGPAAFDFRSDTMTTPTPSMLRAIQNCTLLDDVFREDPTTNDLESHLAQLTGKPAALFVLSGTMGNQLALRSHLMQPPHSILCDSRAHILEWEAGGAASLSGALVRGITPSNGIYLTLSDIQSSVSLGDEIHSCPTRVISLENTLAGTIMPLSEIRAIAAFARQHDIKLHLDGARIWEAVAAGAGSLPDFCREFDSVSLCFSKGLGAPVGSILVGSEVFIKQARWVRKSIGGGTRQLGVLTAAARVAVDETFGKGPNGEGGLLKKSHEMAKRIASKWEDLGGKLTKKTETNMVWLDLDDAGVSAKEFLESGNDHGLKLMSRGRLVVHYQIGENAVARLEKVMKAILEGKREGRFDNDNRERKVGERAYGEE